MTAMLMPAINSYFAIYTVEEPIVTETIGRMSRGMSWDLHATATDRSLAISHARMLALQPGVLEVHVKHVSENLENGTVSVRDVKRCRRGRVHLSREAAIAAAAFAATLAFLLGALF
ncbi:MAG: hypothetical protein EBQ96_04880 [Proteobacteria bacterium]|nr:hypothetical protein [Pseudomonadota bacterium]